MKELAEIARLVTFRRVAPVKNITKSENSESKMSVFFDAITQGKIKTDVEAAEFLYGATPQDPRYKMLRKRLQNHLLKTIIQYDFSKIQSTLAVAKDENQRTLFAVDKLVRLGFYDSGIIIAEKLLKEARASHHTEIEIAALRLLRENAVLSGNRKEYERYDSLLKTTLDRFGAEHAAEEYYQRIEIQFVGSAARNEGAGLEAQRYLHQLEEILKEHTSDTLMMAFFRLQILVMQIYRRYSEAIEVCHSAENYLNVNPLFGTRARFAELATVKMDCWLAVKDYRNVILQGERSAALYRAGGHNWFNIQSLIFLASMHTGQFNTAGEIFLRTMSRPEFHNLANVRKEKWVLFGAYLWVAVTMLYPQEMISKKWFKKFSTNEEVQNIWQKLPVIGKDKEGFNISLLISQLLYFLIHNDPVQYRARLKTLGQYARRNLTTGNNRRTTYFIKMLREAEKKGDTAELFKQLSEQPQTKEQFMEGLEVIPYEVLWQQVFKTNKRKKQKRYRVQKSLSSKSSG